ncbi:MAG: hypothetical protein JW940_03130 [Polyangiaceae bacterium]|nr:hypothetical protein [Polyangiaceae bacterium]
MRPSLKRLVEQLDGADLLEEPAFCPEIARAFKELSESPTADPFWDEGEEIAIAYNVVRLVAPLGTLEVGLGRGGVTMAILAALTQNSTWRASTEMHRAVASMPIGPARPESVHRVASAGLGGRWRVVQEAPCLALPRMVAAGARLDFCFLHGLSPFDVTLVEWFYCDQMLAPGRVIVLHHVLLDSMRALAQFVQNNLPYHLVRPSANTWVAIKTGTDQRHWSDHWFFDTSSSERGQALAMQARVASGRPL